MATGLRQLARRIDSDGRSDWERHVDDHVGAEPQPASCLHCAASERRAALRNLARVAEAARGDFADADDEVTKPDARPLPATARVVP